MRLRGKRPTLLLAGQSQTSSLAPPQSGRSEGSKHGDKAHMNRDFFPCSWVTAARTPVWQSYLVLTYSWRTIRRGSTPSFCAWIWCQRQKHLAAVGECGTAAYSTRVGLGQRGHRPSVGLCWEKGQWTSAAPALPWGPHVLEERCPIFLQGHPEMAQSTQYPNWAACSSCCRCACLAGPGGSAVASLRRRHKGHAVGPQSILG